MGGGGPWALPMVMLGHIKDQATGSIRHRLASRQPTGQLGACLPEKAPQELPPQAQVLQLGHDSHIMHRGHQRSIPHGPGKAHQHPALLPLPARLRGPGHPILGLLLLLLAQAAAAQVLPLGQVLLGGIGRHTHQAALQGAPQPMRVYCCARRPAPGSSVAAAAGVEGLPGRKAGHLLQQVGQLGSIHPAQVVAAGSGRAQHTAQLWPRPCIAGHAAAELAGSGTCTPRVEAPTLSATSGIRLHRHAAAHL